LPETEGGSHITQLRHEGSEPLKDCERRFSTIEKKVDVMSNALFGPDGTNGLVKKMDRIEYQTGLIRFVGQGIFGITISLMTLFVVKALGL
jgi:hypothetical protein